MGEKRIEERLVLKRGHLTDGQLTTTTYTAVPFEAVERLHVLPPGALEDLRADLEYALPTWDDGQYVTACEARSRLRALLPPEEPEEPKLLPCPFCGDPPERMDDGGAMCAREDCAGGSFSVPPSRWNRRAAPKPPCRYCHGTGIYHRIRGHGQEWDEPCPEGCAEPEPAREDVCEAVFADEYNPVRCGNDRPCPDHDLNMEED